MRSLRVVVDLHLAVYNMKVLGVVMETLEWVPFSLLSAYRIFRTADVRKVCAMF